MRTNGKWILILMIVLAGILLPSSTVSAAGETPGVGSTVTFAGTDWLQTAEDGGSSGWGKKISLHNRGDFY